MGYPIQIPHDKKHFLDLNQVSNRKDTGFQCEIHELGEFLFISTISEIRKIREIRIEKFFAKIRIQHFGLPPFADKELRQQH